MASARPIAASVAEDRHQQRAVDEIEVHVGRRQPLLLMDAPAAAWAVRRSSKWPAILIAQPLEACGDSPAAPCSSASRGSCSIADDDRPRHRRTGRGRRCGRRCRRRRCRRPARSRAADRSSPSGSARSPPSINVGLRFLFSRHDVVVITVPAPLKSTAPPSMTMPGENTGRPSSSAIRVGTASSSSYGGYLPPHAL